MATDILYWLAMSVYGLDMRTLSLNANNNNNINDTQTQTTMQFDHFKVGRHFDDDAMRLLVCVCVRVDLTTTR